MVLCSVPSGNRNGDSGDLRTDGRWQRQVRGQPAGSQTRERAEFPTRGDEIAGGNVGRQRVGDNDEEGGQVQYPIDASADNVGAERGGGGNVLVLPDPVLHRADPTGSVQHPGPAPQDLRPQGVHLRVLEVVVNLLVLLAAQHLGHRKVPAALLDVPVHHRSLTFP